MKRTIILFLTIIIFVNINLLGNNGLRSVNTLKENILEAAMLVEIDGTIQLYSVLKEDIELIDTEVIQVEPDRNSLKWNLVYNRDYFIGFSDANLEAITPSNFKRMAKKYFATVPELSENIGKKGFRYKNLPAMIMYYNKKMTKGKTLTKDDKLEVKTLYQ